MALLTIAGEGAAVGIVVAGPAALEDDEIFVLHPPRFGRKSLVTLRAGDLAMETGQREFGLLVRESPKVLPVLLIVAARAGRPQISMVLVIMATSAQRRKSKVRLTGSQVKLTGTRRLHAGNVFGCHLRRVVTLLARQSSVLAFESPAGLSVIETASRGPPAHQLILPPIVFRVAAGAISSRLHSSAFNDPCMVTTLFRQATPDFFVTLQTPELRGSRTYYVTGGTLKRRVQALVGLRQRAGGHLGV